MARLLSIVPNPISADTVRKLAKLHAAALRGEVIGLACTVDHAGGLFTTHVAGEAERRLDRTRGRVLSLNDDLRELMEKALDP